MRHFLMGLVLGGATMAAGPALAQAEGCFGSGEPLFHCRMEGSGKALDLCLQQDVVVYRFGPPGRAAELLLARRVEEVFHLPWNGIGSSIYEELGVGNGDVEYTVWSAVERIAADQPEVSGGVRVTRGDQTLAELRCAEGSTIVRDFYSVFEAKEAKGQCWDNGSFSWGPC